MAGLAQTAAPGASPPRDPADLGPGGIYYGWVNTAISVLLVTLAVGATSYSFGAFIVPASAELGLDRATTNVGLILFHMGSILMNPFLGSLYDRVSYRWMLRASGLSLMVGLIGAGLSQSPLLIGLCIIGPIAFGTAGSATIPGMVLAARWFQERRARAITIIAMGTSFGGMIVFPTIAFLIEYFDWRTTLIIAGSVIGSVVILMSFFIRAKPVGRKAEAGEDAQQSDAQKVLSPLAILAGSRFWRVAIPAAIMMGVDQTMLATITPYMQDRAMGVAAVSSVMAATTAGAIFGKVLVAWIGDKFDLRLLLALTAIFAAVQSIVLLFTPSYEIIFGVFLVTGLAIGGTFPIGSAIMSQQFGAWSTGTALGLSSPLIAGSSSVALYFIGWVHDTNGNYQFGFMVFAGVMTVAALLCAAIPRKPEELI